MPARKPIAADNRCDASPIETLERTLVEARETVIREQAAVIAGLSAEAARLRAALEILQEGVSVCDADGRLQLCNRRFAEIYGLRPDEVRPGASVQHLPRVPPAPEASAETAAPIGASAKTGARTESLPDGRFVEINEAPAPGGGWISTHRDVGERGALADERMSLQKLIDLVPDNLWLKDAASRFVIANDATARRMGYASSANLIGKTDLELCPAKTAQKYFADERRIVESGEPMVDCEEYVIAGDGGTCWISSTKVPLRAEGGEVVGLVGISRDITARKAADRLRDGHARILEMIATNAPLDDILDGLTRLIESQLADVRSSVLLLDEDGVHLRHSAGPSLPERLLRAVDGLSVDPMVGSRATAWLREPVAVADIATDPRWADMRALAEEHGIRSCWSAPILSHQGQALGAFALYSASAREPSGPETALIDVATKIAGIAIERKLAEDRIQHMATHDALTGLPNRALLKDRLSQALLLAERYDRWATVVFIDIDNFKYVNDSLGHNAGDDLLRAVARRMVDCVRATDTVVRLGGDEFVIVLSDQTKRVEGISETVTRLQEAVAEPVRIGSHALRVTMSVGLASFPNDGRDAETLLANADAAMYRAKESGRDNVQFYRPEINLHVQEKFRLQEALRSAVLRNEFVLHYQPQVNLQTGAILAVEALIRWRHPTLGLLPPLRFIPLAEESGMITVIGEWVLNEACRQAEAWRRQGLPPIRMSVNVSARQFRERRLTTAVAAALRDSGLDPRLLELELTESLIMQDVDQAVATMEELERLGVQLSIDDFGTGYSSLAGLKTFPVARLKIDKAFINGLPGDPDDMAVATAVISLGQKLNLKVIAEGVETAEQADFLRRNHCDEIQGYCVSRPIPPDELAAFLSDWVRHDAQGDPDGADARFLCAADGLQARSNR